MTQAVKKQKVGMDLTQGSILRNLITFAIPIIIASVVQQLYSMVDLMVIGQYVGNEGTVGVSTGSEISDFLTPIAMAFATGGQIYIGQLTGAKNQKKIEDTIATLLTMMVVLSVVGTILPIVLCHPLLKLLNCPEEAYGQASSYLIITAIGMPFIFGYNAISAVLRGMGEAKRPMLFIIIAAIINIFADIFLVAVIPLEAAGTAIATVLSQIGCFVASFVYMYKRREQFGFELSISYFRIDKQALGVILKLGIPQLFRSIFVRSSMLWVKSNVNSYGMVVAGTYSVGNKLEKFMDVFVSGVDQAAGNMMAQNIGAKKFDRTKKTMWTTLCLTLCMAMVVVAVYQFIPKPLYRLFTTDEAVIEMGVIYLNIMSVGAIVHAYGATFKSITTGAGAYKLSFVVGLLDGVSRILACVVFEQVFHQGAQSYFWGAALCFLLPGIVSMIYFLSGTWERKKLLSEE